MAELIKTWTETERCNKTPLSQKTLEQLQELNNRVCQEVFFESELIAELNKVFNTLSISETLANFSDDMPMSGDDFMKERNAMKKEIVAREEERRQLEQELRISKSDNQMLKDTIVRMSMKLNGVLE